MTDQCNKDQAARVLAAFKVIEGGKGATKPLEPPPSPQTGWDWLTPEQFQDIAATAYRMAAWTTTKALQEYPEDSYWSPHSVRDYFTADLFGFLCSLVSDKAFDSGFVHTCTDVAFFKGSYLREVLAGIPSDWVPQSEGKKKASRSDEGTPEAVTQLDEGKFDERHSSH